MRLFVYGTLLRGEANHAMLAGALYVGEHLTAPAFTLLDLGDYPALLEQGATAILGELYDVDPDLLAALDAFEGHPELFERRALPGSPGASAYFLAPAQAGRVTTGAVVLASGSYRARRIEA